VRPAGVSHGFPRQTPDLTVLSVNLFVQINTNGRSPEYPSRLVRRSDVPSPQQLRQQEQREKKLRDMQDQVAQGKLVIRRMTADERKRYPPRDTSGPATRSKRR
jgi:hypothetical protein